MDMQLRDC